MDDPPRPATTTTTTTNHDTNDDKNGKEERGDCSIIRSLQKIDPILRFLTKATGATTVPRALLRKALPVSGLDDDLTKLVSMKVLFHDVKNDRFGFPPMTTIVDGSVTSGTMSTNTTKRAAQKRLTMLRRLLKKDDEQHDDDNNKTKAASKRNKKRNEKQQQDGATRCNCHGEEEKD
jgi:hypothetical protein